MCFRDKPHAGTEEVLSMGHVGNLHGCYPSENECVAAVHLLILIRDVVDLHSLFRAPARQSITATR